MLGKGGAGAGPAWTRGEIERPQGEKDVGGSTVSFYTQEQQQRLGVDEQGNQGKAAAVVRSALCIRPCFTVTHHTIPYSHHHC